MHNQGGVAALAAARRALRELEKQTERQLTIQEDGEADA